MVDVRGAFGAVVAVDCLSTISVVGIFSWFTTFGDFEGGFGNDLVHGVSSSSEDFARVAVAENMLALVRSELDSPFVVLAVASSSV